MTYKVTFDVILTSLSGRNMVVGGKALVVANSVADVLKFMHSRMHALDNVKVVASVNGDYVEDNGTTGR